MSIKRKILPFLSGFFCGVLILFLVYFFYDNNPPKAFEFDSITINKIYSNNGNLYQNFMITDKDGKTEMRIDGAGNYNVEKSNFIPNGNWQYYGTLGNFVLVTKDLGFNEFIIASSLTGETLIRCDKLGKLIATSYYKNGKEVYSSQHCPPAADLELYSPIENISYSDGNRDGIWDIKIDTKNSKRSIFISGRWYNTVDKDHIIMNGKKVKFIKENNKYLLDTEKTVVPVKKD